MAVKTNVEYQAMQKEIEFAQTEVKKLEDQMLERMVEADELTAARQARGSRRSPPSRRPSTPTGRP